MADSPAVDTTKGNKLTASFKKHKAAWIIGGLFAVVFIYLIIRFYSNSQQNSANQAAAQNGNLTSSGIAGTGPIDLTGSQGPAGPAGPTGKQGPPGKRGKRGPPGKPAPKKPPVHHKRSITTPPTHMQPSHTSGHSAQPDNSHAVKARETHPVVSGTNSVRH